MWKDVVNFETRFAVSDCGEVFSKVSKKLLKPHVCSRGYLRVTTKINGKNVNFFVHRLVAEAFVPNPEGKPFINHKDCVKQNNKYDNLEWCTAKENSRHAKDNKLFKPARGEDNSGSVLTEEEVRFIRQKYIPGDKEFSGASLARKFGVAQSLISEIVNCRKWSHI